MMSPIHFFHRPLGRSRGVAQPKSHLTVPVIFTSDGSKEVFLMWARFVYPMLVYLPCIFCIQLLSKLSSLSISSLR